MLNSFIWVYQLLELGINPNLTHKLNKCTKDKYDLDNLACELKTVLKVDNPKYKVHCDLLGSIIEKIKSNANVEIVEVIECSPAIDTLSQTQNHASLPLDLSVDDVPCSILNDDIDLNLVKKHFTDDAWLAVNDIFETKFELGWYCQSCRDCLTTGPSVGCDDCFKDSSLILFYM